MILRTCKVDDIPLSILTVATPRDLGLSHLLGYGLYKLGPDHARKHQLYPLRRNSIIHHAIY
jgi:hypothetical protein